MRTLQLWILSPPHPSLIIVGSPLYVDRAYMFVRLYPLLMSVSVTKPNKGPAIEFSASFSNRYLLCSLPIVPPPAILTLTLPWGHAKTGGGI